MKTETKDDKVYVYGRFWDMWYALDGKNLYCLGGDENAGRLEMTKQDGIFKVTGFEKVRDGSYYPEDWKRLCGEDRDLYERFFTKEEREDRREIVRGELILQYAQDNGLDIESYQDFGWDPVLLPEPDFITAESVEGKEQLVQYIPGVFGGSGVFALDMILFSTDGTYTRDNIASVTYDTTHFDENQQEEMKKQLELFKEKLFQYKDASKQLVAVGEDMYLLKKESLYFGGEV